MLGRPFSSLRHRHGAALFLALILLGCGEETPERPAPATPEEARAREIIAASMAAHGGGGFQGGTLHFHFRGADFRVVEDGGLYYQELVRATPEGRITEAMANQGTFRWLNGTEEALSPEAIRSLETAVNSVIYFAFLPYRLEDHAVRARFLGDETLGGQPYHLVEVTFREDGGGRDFDDRFLYWFHRDSRLLDYLAYYYHTGGGGSRFRKAIHRRTVDGLVIQDYDNYVGEVDGVELGMDELERYGGLFEGGELRLVSQVILEGVSRSPIPDPRPWDALAAGGMPAPGPRWDGDAWREGAPW